MVKSVYISATYEDLKEYREAAVFVIRSFGLAPKDSYSAGPKPVVESCLADVDACDAFVGIVGLRYGWIPDKNDGRSITHREFEQARDKIRLIFVRDEPADLDEKILEFRNSLPAQVRTALFKNVDEFTSALRRALKQELGARPIDPQLRLLPYFCDRTPQTDRIDDILRDRKENGKSQVVTFVIHGDQQQSGSRVMEVLRQRHPEYRALKDGPPPETFRPAWPAGKVGSGDFAARYQREIGLVVMQDRGAPREEIERRLLAIDAPVVIQTHIDTSIWLECGKDAVRAFFAFWDSWTTLRRVQPVIAVLHVEYELPKSPFDFLQPGSRRRAKGQIRDFLRAPFTPSNSILGILPELEVIPRLQAIEWSRLPQVRSHIKNADLEPEINNLFDTRFANAPQKMEPLAKELLTLLLAQA